MTVSVNAFTRLSISVEKMSVGGSHVVATSSSSSAQLDGKQPKAELQRGAAEGNTAYIIEFPAVTYINLNYLALPWRSVRTHLS